MSFPTNAGGVQFAGQPGFYCARDGLLYDRNHAIHPEDLGNPPPLSRLADLERRMALVRGEYDVPCPTCDATAGMWCHEHGESLLEMHPARQP